MILCLEHEEFREFAWRFPYFTHCDLLCFTLIVAMSWKRNIPTQGLLCWRLSVRPAALLRMTAYTGQTHSSMDSVLQWEPWEKGHSSMSLESILSRILLLLFCASWPPRRDVTLCHDIPPCHRSTEWPCTQTSVTTARAILPFEADLLGLLSLWRKTNKIILGRFSNLVWYFILFLFPSIPFTCLSVFHWKDLRYSAWCRRWELSKYCHILSRRRRSSWEGNLSR